MRFRLLLCLLLTGCSAPAIPATSGAFNPLQFFTGHVTSWGVEENRAGAPTAIVTTDCNGTLDPSGQLRMVQVLHIGGAKPQTRIWEFTQTGANTFIATANDMSGSANGVVAGRVFHWRWILQTHRGNPLANVMMEQYMYRLDNGNVMIRTVASKLGFRLLEVSEVFQKVTTSGAN
jgi:hypothetical protein